ncbi:20S cyclosome subunit (APC8), putative [Talaromyces stipitatus ATCC 10500]|uniref:20S cyclosome subunit (APC8), putative n=1 Tax=Talaromyces stipitatus (strain ATCC 10500 / CBS 375.48 / QM 6759 / NRRL 1006) TaxID=441959 RepID=B8MAT6_TALSN|nr:20S cyclosome subunit (APC8), putative [Talaromyces stipitatus ATCC 10500]EED17776.1 20S cyclosome subunit (APC8), putative [Talaromyces stipitatus ATCC 10500]
MAMTFTEDSIKELRLRLEDAVIKCSERCLYQSAKWAAEMLNSLVSTDGNDTDAESPVETEPQPHVNPFTSQSDPTEAALELQEAHKYLLAKSYFDTREYDRCAAVFLPPTIPPVSLSNVSPNVKSRTSLTPQKGKRKSFIRPGSKAGQALPRNPYPKLSQKSLFLALYAKYLAGEKRRDEETEMVLGPADGGMTVNRELPDLARGLEGWFAEREERGLQDRGQGWLEYLYAVILLKGKNEEEAKKWLVRSVHLFPFHWGAWQELNELLPSVDDLKQVAETLPQNIMSFIFQVHCSQELYQATDETHQTLNGLESIFPTSSFLKTERALLYYHSRDFEEASAIFADILIEFPHRLDSLDHYSNILYVMGARPQLAFVAQLATATDKFRPETCCVVGNYYSLKSEHEKAVMYFRRALTLDRNFLSAWTLMGHEYIEMKNTHAAIESYRRAVDVNRKDYRAWYGLGQAYEVLDMSFYALYYYQRTAALKPYDPKMWLAVGTCYAKMGRLQHSIKAMKRALVAGAYYEQSLDADPTHPSAGRKVLDPDTLHQIALLYERLGDEDEAAAYMELTLQQESGEIERNEMDSDDDDDALGDDGNSDDETTGLRSRRQRRRQQKSRDDDNEVEAVGGTGVTATTSKARLWLARWALKHGDLNRADQLASELCQDGIEVEEAKALMRDVRARREGGDEKQLHI